MWFYQINSYSQNRTMKCSFDLIRSTKSSSEIVSNEFAATVAITTADIIEKIVALFMILFVDTHPATCWCVGNPMLEECGRMLSKFDISSIWHLFGSCGLLWQHLENLTLEMVGVSDES